MIASPPGLRSRLVGIVATAALLAAALTVLTVLVQHETRVVAEAAQQSAPDADLYLQSNELDLDLSQILLLDDSPALASQKLNATAGYQIDNDDIDGDLRAAEALAPGDRAAIQQVQQVLTSYRTQAAPAKAATTRAAGMSAYQGATGFAHRSLLPAELALSNAVTERMSTAVRHERLYYWAGIAVSVVLGLALLTQLLLLLAKRRGARAPLATAAVVTLAVLAAAITVLHLGDTRLRAGHDDVTAALAGEKAEGIGYDVVADPMRYLISGRDRQWATDATAEDLQVRRSVGGGTWIAWDVFDNSLTGIFTGIDQGQLTPADVSLYNVDTGTSSEFIAFKNADYASARNLYTNGQRRLSAAQSLRVARIIIPIAGALLFLFLLALLFIPRSRRPVPETPTIPSPAPR